MKRFTFTLLIMMLAGWAAAVDLTDARWYTIKVGNGGYLSTASGYHENQILLLSNTT